MCTAYSVTTPVTEGTIEQRSHTPFSTWFAAVWFVTSPKHGVSAQGLQDALGLGRLGPRGFGTGREPGEVHLFLRDKALRVGQMP